MFIENHAPAEPLGKYIDFFTYFKGYSPGHSIERVVPDGHIYLIFELDNIPRQTFDKETLEPIQKFNGCWFSGFQKNYISISAHNNSEMFVIRFKPHGALPFIKKPLDEFKDSVIQGEAIFGEQIHSLRQSLLGAPTAGEKYRLVEDWLSLQFDEAFTPHPDIITAIKRISRDPEFDDLSLKSLVEDSGYSKKHFINLFRKSVGTTPKYFQRILRFNCIIPKVQQQQEISWPQISAECGFYDQAHFIKEFRAFSGYNPQEFLVEQDGHGEVNFFPVQ